MAERLFLGNMMVTELGGLAIKLTNKTGATSVKGTLVDAHTSVASAFALVGVGGVDPCGIVYGDDAGEQVADAVECWVVVTGIAQVLFTGSTTLGHFARMSIAADTGDAAGLAQSEAVPTSPFATDKHFQEIGHVIEAIGAAGLAKCVLHFN